jgi:hypothetical protein
MPAREQIVASALDPSSLSMTRGTGRGCRPGCRQVVSSVSGSLPSWIVGNPVGVASVHFLIAYVPEQTLSCFTDAAAPSVVVPSWDYVSRRLHCTHLNSFLLFNVADQSSFSNAYHKYFLSMLVLLCSFPPYGLSL